MPTLTRCTELSVEDIEHFSAKYWSMWTDPIMSRDFSMFIILICHVGLTIGVLSRHLHKRPDLVPLVDRLLRFDTIGLYLMTERGHGLDVFNLETTATKTSEGFVINTPREEASKLMPASTPSFGIPKVAVVLARLIVDGEDRGPRFFIAPICNEREMFKGVESIRLGPRPGTTPLDFAITRFDSVVVPDTAMVTSTLGDYSLPKSPLEAMWNENWRIQIGGMTVLAPAIPSLKAMAFIAGKYSMHRCITGKASERIPIISFRTQQWPILHAVSVSLVMDNWYSVAIGQITEDPSLDPRVRHGLSVVVKTTLARHASRCVSEISERCGAQGTFENNFMARFENDLKGAVISEGDILTLCIRLFSELLQQRYQLPLPDLSESLLARHAVSLFEENKALLQTMPEGHRSQAFNARIFPQSEYAIEAMGHAMAYSAALQKGLPKSILDIYECAVIRRDPAWYVEQGGLTRYDLRVREDEAVTRALPHLATFLDGLGIEEYVSAPIVSDAALKAYYGKLPVFKGNTTPNISFDQGSTTSSRPFPGSWVQSMVTGFWNIL
ncbi:acyl-CoA oxidase [Chiua virens]|nr:acyl-CoA oxidase [Chiua virens]